MKTEGRRSSQNVQDFRQRQPLGDHIRSAWNPALSAIGFGSNPTLSTARDNPVLDKMIRGMGNVRERQKKNLDLRGGF